VILAVHDGQTRRAQPGQRGVCPFCQEPVIAKCGTIVVWHWAHEADRSCSDSWGEESWWHLGWKQWALEQGWRVEVPIEQNGVRHRADIVTPAGWVIELQHSGLDARQIDERERFYGRLIWIWDMGEREERFGFNDRPTWTGFRWKRPMWSLCAIRRPLYLDFGGDGLLRASLSRVPSWYGDFDICVGRGVWGTRDLLAAALSIASNEPVNTYVAGAGRREGARP
jgi:hypothetical protein